MKGIFHCVRSRAARATKARGEMELSRLRRGEANRSASWKERFHKTGILWARPRRERDEVYGLS